MTIITSDCKSNREKLPSKIQEKRLMGNMGIRRSIPQAAFEVLKIRGRGLFTPSTRVRVVVSTRSEKPWSPVVV
jgi:hypothetical protein